MKKMQGYITYLRDRTPLRYLDERWALGHYDITQGLAGLTPPPVVMTDYMDTLVHRSYSIVDALKRWSKEMGGHFGISAKNIEECRLSIAGGPLHCTVLPEVVYGMVADHCIVQGVLNPNQREEFCDVAHEIEMRIELEGQSVVPATRDFLAAAREGGSTIACITDLRLSGNDVRVMLKEHNLLEVFDYVISSADVGITKRDGGLYDYALSLIGASPEDCLMVGDNLHSDCINAAKHDIRACWIA